MFERSSECVWYMFQESVPIVVRPAYPAPEGGARLPLVEDDESDEEGVPGQDGTLVVSGPPRPLYVENYHCLLVVIITARFVIYIE